MKKCVFAGSFDPFTLGHLDVVEKALSLFDEVYVVVSGDVRKDALLTCEDRVSLIKKAVKNKNIKVVAVNGLLADFCAENGIKFIVKGARNSTDFNYENEMNKINKSLGEIDTILFFASPTKSFISSSFVRELLRLKKDISTYVPKEICEDIVSLYSREETKYKNIKV